MFRSFRPAYIAIFLAKLMVVWPAGAQIDEALIKTDATHAVIMDFDSGAVLFSKNGEDLMIPASMTKMMTVQVIFNRLASGELQLSDKLRTSQNAWKKGGFSSGGSTMGLAINDEPTIEELLRGIIVLSGNDACIVVAEGLAGTEELFAQEMTAVAREMGLASATFKNATGLDDEGHRISAIDLAKLARAQISQFPDYYAFYNETSYEWNGIKQNNRNPLLGRVKGVDGLKTGHLSVSGYGVTISGEQDGIRRIIVLNGLESSARRAQESDRMFRIAFTAFETRTFDKTDEPLADLPIWLGVQRTVPVAVKTPVTVSAHKRAFQDMTTEIIYNGPIEAPIEAGTEIGTLLITLPGQPPVSTPLVTLSKVDKLGFMGRVFEGLNRLMASDDDA